MRHWEDRESQAFCSRWGRWWDEGLTEVPLLWAGNSRAPPRQLWEIPLPLGPAGGQVGCSLRRRLYSQTLGRGGVGARRRQDRVVLRGRRGEDGAGSPGQLSGPPLAKSQPVCEGPRLTAQRVSVRTSCEAAVDLCDCAGIDLCLNICFQAWL